MSLDDSKGRKASAKEFARTARRAAYEKAKEQRAKDPRYLAMKEAAREHRRELYRQIKERRKATKVEQKAKEEKARAEARAETYQELMKLVTWGTKGASGSTTPN